MNIADFDYELPKELIAQKPAPQRDLARLMVDGERQTGSSGIPECEHRLVRDLPDLLRPSDLLVLNDTRVFPARLIGSKESGGRIEVLLLARTSARDDRQIWRALIGSSRMPQRGARIAFGGGLTGVLIEPPVEGIAPIALELEEGGNEAGGNIDAVIDRTGQIPLPPYIEREAGPRSEDRERYQTVFAREPGAAAAPTAGLHFTPDVLAR